MNARLDIDERRWPKVYIVWPDAPLSDEEFRRGITHLGELTHRGQPFVMLHDARHAHRPSATQRRYAAKRQRDDAAYSSRWLRGTAMVVASPIIAGVVTAINWVTPPPYPQKIFSTMDEAEAWIAEQLAANSR